MNRPNRLRLRPAWLAVGAFFALLPADAFAQGADFLFRAPRVGLAFSAGYAMPRAQSELFDFTREQLTLETADFGAPTVQGEITVWLRERLDVALGVGWASSTTRSEFEHLIGSDDLPIEQTTRFARLPLTAGVKAYLVDRGRTLSRFAWVPSAWAPYLGAGVGGVWYVFEQVGEFVDYETNEIFWEHFLSDGWAPTAHLRAGLDLTLRPRVALTTEGRYQWGSTDLSRDFVGFDEIDLAGFQATIGLSFRF